MRIHLARYAFVLLTAVFLSGCYSGGKWNMPRLASWRSNPFKSSSRSATDASGIPTPSAIASNSTTPAPGAGYQGTTPSMTPPSVSYPGTAASYNYNVATGYPSTQQPYPSTAPAATGGYGGTGTVSNPYVASQSGQYGYGTPATTSPYANPVGSSQQYQYQAGTDPYATQTNPPAAETDRYATGADRYATGTSSYGAGSSAPYVAQPATPYGASDSGSGYGAPDSQYSRDSYNSGSSPYGANPQASTATGTADRYSTPSYGASSPPSYGASSYSAAPPTDTQYPPPYQAATQPQPGSLPAGNPGTSGYGPGPSSYTPGAPSSYTPGNTGYAPQGTTPYQSPAGPYGSPLPTNSSGYLPPYQPGSVRSYEPNQPEASGPSRVSSGYGGASPEMGSSIVPAEYTQPAGSSYQR